MTATRAFAASKYGQILYSAIGCYRPTIGTMGESHGIYLDYAIWYSCAQYFNADITWDDRTYANGGQLFAVGGTTTTGPNGLTTQATWFATRPSDIVFIASGYNDAPSISTAPTIANTVQTVAESCFASGAKNVIICGMTPGGGATVAGSQSYNNLMRNWVRGRNGAFFLDITDVIINMADTSGTMAYRQTGNVIGSYTIDGTHWSPFAQRLIAQKIADIFKKITPQRLPRDCFSSGAYDPVNGPWSNITGDAGTCLGTSGLYNGSPDSGVAGTGTASRISILPTTVTSSNSIVTGSLGERKQRLTLGGAGAGNILVGITPTITNVNNSDATRLYDFEAVVDLTNVVGLCDVSLRVTSSSPQYITPAIQNAALPACWPDNTTIPGLYIYSMYPFAISGNNPAFYVLLQFPEAPTGTIDISRMSAVRVA